MVYNPGDVTQPLMPQAIPRQGLDRNFISKGLSGVDQLIARKPGIFPAGMTGAGPAVIGRTLLGAGLGYGAGALAETITPGSNSNARKRFAMMGGLAGLVGSAPDLYATAAGGRSFMDGNFAKTAPSEINPQTGGQMMSPPMVKTAKAKGWVGVPISGPLREAALELAQKVSRHDLLPGGRETKPHVTVAYGLHTEDPELVKDKIQDFKGVKLRLGEISIFSHPKQDVVKVEVTGTNLHRMHHKLHGTLRSKPTHKIYRPHLTLAYVKPGTGHKYVGKHHLQGRRFLAGKVLFNNNHKAMHTIPLTKTAALETLSNFGTRDKIAKRKKWKVWQKTTDDSARNPNWKNDLTNAITKQADPDYTRGYYPWQPYSPISSLGYTGMPAVDVNSAANSILANPSLTPPEKSMAFEVLSNASRNGSRSLSAMDLLKGAIGAGLGYHAGAFVGRTFGPLYGERAGGAGAVLGFQFGTGAFQR